MLTPERLWEIKERCERATPGPWIINLEHQREMLSGRRILPAIEGPNGVMVAPLLAPRYSNAHISRNDAEFIAHSREDVPALVAEVERLWGLVGELREWVKRWRSRANDWRCPETWMAGDDLYEQFCDGKAAGLSEAADDLEAILNRLEAKRAEEGGGDADA